MRAVPYFLFFFAMLLATVASASAGTPIAVPQDQSATRIDITQHGEPHDAWDKLTGLTQHLAWPITLAIALYLFRGSIRKIIEHLGRSGGEISIAGLGIKLPVAEGASVGDDVLFFKTADPTAITNDSAKTTLLKMLRDPSTREYVVIKFRNGK